jgi:hypothetical protein
LNKTLKDPAFVIEAVRVNAMSTLAKVVDPGGLDGSDFDKRANLWAYSLAGILHGVHVTGELTPADADASLTISLSLWNLSPAVASKLTSRPLAD